MQVRDLALAQGVRETRGALAQWRDGHWAIVRVWIACSALVAVSLLAAVYVVASLSTPDPTGVGLTRGGSPGSLKAVAHILAGNSLVLALHAFACVAGFIAGSSLPRSAETMTGLWRRVHERAGPLAIAFVVAATTFSLVTQAYILGGWASTLAAQVGLDPGVLLVGLLPHAVPELVALFLPLAAWLVASRSGRWNELLAATLVTVALAVPVLTLAAAVEVFVSPHVLTVLR